MTDVNAAPITMKCKICGGDIRNDYLVGSCACANCGNRWSITDLVPDYNKYERIIGTITKANEIINSEAKVASANEAKLLYKQAIMECTKFNDAVSSDLVRLCNEGQVKADQLAIYYKGKTFFEKKSFKSALKELGKVPGYRDADEMIARCNVEIEAERRRGIPWAVIFSLIIPASIGIALREFAHWPIVICILIFLAGSAGLGYVLYRGGAWSIVIKIVSFLCAAPLILFCVLAYGLHLSTGLSLAISILGPIILFVLFAVLTERKEK